VAVGTQSGLLLETTHQVEMRQIILLQVVLPALLISGAGLKLYGVSVSTASEAG
jgi:hypothetical protein